MSHAFPSKRRTRSFRILWPSQNRQIDMNQLTASEWQSMITLQEGYAKVYEKLLHNDRERSELLWSILKTIREAIPEVDLKKVTHGDLAQFLMQLRRYSKDSTIVYTSQCVDCGTSNAGEIDLSDLALGDSPIDREYDLKYDEDTVYKIRFRHATIWREMQMNEMVQNEPKLQKVKTVTENGEALAGIVTGAKDWVNIMSATETGTGTPYMYATLWNDRGTSGFPADILEAMVDGVGVYIGMIIEGKDSEKIPRNYRIAGIDGKRLGLELVDVRIAATPMKTWTPTVRFRPLKDWTIHIDAIMFPGETEFREIPVTGLFEIEGWLSGALTPEEFLDIYDLLDVRPGIAPYKSPIKCRHYILDASVNVRLSAELLELETQEAAGDEIDLDRLKVVKEKLKRFKRYASKFRSVTQGMYRMHKGKVNTDTHKFLDTELYRQCGAKYEVVVKEFLSFFA